ncbi:MAG: Dabb family protein [Acidobacteria bacterium]|nr:Dabb family protein [Acidobacteriota bacterium]
MVEHIVLFRWAEGTSREAYYPHPEHQRVLQNFVNPLRAEILALDYEL